MFIKTLKHKIRKIQASLYHKNRCYKFDENWFKGKRVAIIGGADSAIQEENGKLIDDFDCVVRINKGVEIIESQKKFVGGRTDFLFHAFLKNANDIGSSPMTPELWKNHKVKHIVYSFNHRLIKSGIYDLLVFKRETKNNFEFAELSKELHVKNEEALHPFRPTTGFIAINTIFNCQPKELYITGITFFKTPHNKSYRKGDLNEFTSLFTKKHGAHNPDEEYKFVKQLYLDNQSIIKPDRVLRQIFETN